MLYRIFLLLKMPKVLPTASIGLFQKYEDYHEFLQKFYSIYSYNHRYAKFDIFKTSTHKIKVQYQRCNNPPVGFMLN